ncbi:hypothetical protein NDU88_003117 [Pleurodeles waltl]|uniref:Uncharacterized protein n=1 Tax=Pleurodeles waltl TaxID=8319 RepID=A0AAV7TMI8_PLEWA|nr:hypothetical protein NDU88_003117 [Pleurodeles waltl]
MVERSSMGLQRVPHGVANLVQNLELNYEDNSLKDGEIVKEEMLGPYAPQWRFKECMWERRHLNPTSSAVLKVPVTAVAQYFDMQMTQQWLPLVEFQASEWAPTLSLCKIIKPNTVVGSVMESLGVDAGCGLEHEEARLQEGRYVKDMGVVTDEERRTAIAFQKTEVTRVVGGMEVGVNPGSVND